MKKCKNIIKLSRSTLVMRGLWRSLAFQFYFLMLWVRQGKRLPQQLESVVPSTPASGSVGTGEDTVPLEISTKTNV